jgi:hypothetical protein
MITSSTSAAVDACPGNGVLHGVATQGGAVGHVESALPAFGQGGAGGGNDNGLEVMVGIPLAFGVERLAVRSGAHANAPRRTLNDH